MPLTQFTIVNAQPAEKAYKLPDGDGLHLLVKPSGNKHWRFRYRFLDRENMLALGVFPTVGLAEARKRRDDAKKLLAAGTDPSQAKKLDRLRAGLAAQNTFGAVAKEYLSNLKASRVADITLAKNEWLLERLAAPIAHRPIAEIVPAEILDLLKRVEKSGRRETAKRLRATMSTVFRLAIVTLRATNDPTTALKGALLRPNVQPRAAITDEKQFGALLRALDEFDGWPTISAAMKFMALTCTRPGEVRQARRTEINFEKALWRIPAERTKMRRQHDVPLSRQAIAVLRDMSALSDSMALRVGRHPNEINESSAGSNQVAPQARNQPTPRTRQVARSRLDGLTAGAPRSRRGLVCVARRAARSSPGFSPR